MDLTQLSDVEKKQIKAQIELFKHQWQLHQLGEYHRLTDAQNDRWFTAWQVVSEDKSVALVQLCAVGTPSECTGSVGAAARSAGRRSV